MIVKRRGVDLKRPWMARDWICARCGTVVHLTAEDTVQSHWDDPAMEYVRIACPMCNESRMFFPHQEDAR